MKKVTREDLLKSKEFWMVQIQNELFGIIEEYMKKKKFNRTKLAEEFGVSKGYITQVLNGDFDHKLSKLIEFSLASGKAPYVNFIDLKEYIKNDSENKFYDLIPIVRPTNMTYTKMPSQVVIETKGLSTPITTPFISSEENKSPKPISVVPFITNNKPVAQRS